MNSTTNSLSGIGFSELLFKDYAYGVRFGRPLSEVVLAKKKSPSAKGRGALFNQKTFR